MVGGRREYIRFGAMLLSAGAREKKVEGLKNRVQEAGDFDSVLSHPSPHFSLGDSLPPIFLANQNLMYWYLLAFCFRFMTGLLKWMS